MSVQRPRILTAIGSAMNVDGVGHSRWMEHSAPRVSENVVSLSSGGAMENQPGLMNPFAAGKQVASEFVSIKKQFEFGSAPAVPKPRLKSVIIGPSAVHDPDPLVAVVPSLLRKVLTYISIRPSPSFLKCLNHVDLDHNTLIPAYFHDNDLLVHLAFIIYPQLGDHALEKIAKDYMDLEKDVPEGGDDMSGNMNQAELVEQMDETHEDAEADLEVLDAPPAVFQTPRKKKTVKIKERLDDSLLRRSRRISNKLQGYKNIKSAKKAQEPAEKINEEEIIEAAPLAMIPPGQSSSSGTTPSKRCADWHS